MLKRNESMKYLNVSLTEEMIMNYSALPPEMGGWRRYRIEYGGIHESCVREEIIYLPPFADPSAIERLMRRGQRPPK